MIRVLVVDDRPESRYLLRTLLQGDGCEVTEARNGVEALGAARSAPPDLVVSDLLMPVMDGYTLLRHWKADEQLARIPFVVYTATYTEPRDERLALDLGADAFIPKPADPDALVARLRQICDRAEHGELSATPPPALEEPVVLREYNEVLVRKLEEKARDLDDANRALAAREARLRAILDNEPECVKLLAADGSLLEMNAAGLRLIEAESLAQVKNQCVYPLIVEEHRPAFQNLIERVFRGESGVLEFEMVGIEGTHHWMEMHAAPLRDERGTVTALLGITRDISGRRSAEEHIRRLNRTYIVLSSINKLIVREREPQVILDSACRIAVEQGAFQMAWVGLLSASDGSWRALAHERASGEAMELAEKIESIPREKYVIASQVLETGHYVVCNDIANDPRVTRDQRDEALRRGYRAMVSLPIVARGSCVGVFNLYAAEVGFFDEDEMRLLDELAADIGFALEVSERERERERAEAALRESEERFRELAETIEDVFWVFDATSLRVLYVSPGFERLRGRSSQSLSESPFGWLEFVPPEDRERMERAIRAARSGIPYDEEYRLQRLDGQVRWVRDRAFPVRDATGEVVRIVGVARDVTDLRKLEEQLRRVQRIEATGHLAAGIAHDFNNALTVIIGGCELARDSVGSSSPAAQELQQIVEAAMRSARLTQQLLAFTRQQAMRPRVLDLKEHLRGVEHLLRRTIPESVTIEWKLQSNRWLVLIDPAQVDQVILNLAVNARDAMPDGGSLVIEAVDVTLDAAGCAGRLGLSPGDYVRLTVRDTGHGMDAETLEHAFEPFFTTKLEGKGTGLGLPSVYGIVMQNHGFVEVKSETGRGTAVVIHLPRAKGESVGAPERETTALDGGHETVLLVEDNGPVRTLTRRFLEKLGYRVLEAADAPSALALSDAHEGEIDLLLTDVVMPDMDGIALARSIEVRRPQIRVLYMSGYAPGGAPGTGHVLSGTDHYIQKPLALGALAAAIRRALGEGGAASG